MTASLQKQHCHSSPPLTPALAVEFAGVSFSYGTQPPAIEESSFSLGANESFCIIGPNGGGKTTLVRLILGLLKPESGSIRVFGTPPPDVSRRVAYVPQVQQLNPMLPISVDEMLRMPLLKSNNPDKAQSRIDELRTRFQLEELSGRNFHSLSAGQKQRALIARALVDSPRMLILDEPMAHADPKVEHTFRDELQRLQHECLLLVVTHDISLVYAMFRKVLCVHRKVRIHDTRQIDHQLLRNLYGGDLRWVEHNHA